MIYLYIGLVVLGMILSSLAGYKYNDYKTIKGINKINGVLLLVNKANPGLSEALDIITMGEMERIFEEGEAEQRKAEVIPLKVVKNDDNDPK